MATFRITVQKQRSDGYWPVYIRVTHQRKIVYINYFLERNEIHIPIMGLKIMVTKKHENGCGNYMILF